MTETSTNWFRDGILKKKEVGKEAFCEHCVVGKATKLVLRPRSMILKMSKITFILTYGAHQMCTPLSGNQYFLSIIDDHSKKVRPYSLRQRMIHLQVSVIRNGW